MKSSCIAPAGSGTGQPLVSVVVIGRNEGDRLRACLQSISAMSTDGKFAVETIYVDSASTDGSAQNAAALGVRVIAVRPERPSAALGRNAGWREARGEFVLFLDGDTQLHPRFVVRALEAMRNSAVAVVWGHRRESNPGQSIYVRALDLDWIYAPGPSQFCGGDALMRRDVLEQVGGFDASLIAGEEPELCRRIRAHGHIIQHIDVPMTLHDLAITRFSAYWKRAYRAGHAYAEVAARFKGSDDPLWHGSARRNMLHGGLILALIMMLPMAVVWPWLGAGMMAVVLGLLGRTFLRCAWKSSALKTRALYALHSHFQQLPILAGQAGYRLGARTGRQHRLIEYKCGSET